MSPFSLQQLSDRIEINDLLIRYTTAIDTKSWTLLDSCFAPAAPHVYTSAGGIKGALILTKTCMIRAKN